jgi:hypothetical protein
MAHIVPPKPRAYVVFGRPKTRSAARISLALGALAVITSFTHAEPAPVQLLLVAAAIGAGAALILRIVERPRHFTEYRAARTLGVPIFHLTSGKSRSDS